MQELAEELRDREHDVTVATCYPHHNMAENSPREVLEDSCEAGVRIIRIRTIPPHKGNFLIRGLSQITLPHFFCSQLRRGLHEKVDAVIVYSPPLPLWRVGSFIKKEYGASFLLNVQDLFPQNAVDLGVLRNPLLIGFFKIMEKKAYENADIVTVHSLGNGDFLLKTKTVRPSKLVTLHNWVDMRAYDKVQNNGFYRKKMNLEKAFILFFGGVMGPSQGLDLILDAAEDVRGEGDIVFLLAGDGIEKERLMRRAQKEHLNNVRFHPFVSKEEYGKLLKEVDVGLVCLASRNKTPVVPGKILGYMAAGIPILAFLNRESDGHQIIREARCGFSEISDTQNPSQLILKMFGEKNRLKEMGRNGFQYAADHFSKKICIDKLEGLL